MLNAMDPTPSKRDEGPSAPASPGKNSTQGKKSTHQIEKFKNKKGSFLDQYVLDSSENLSKLFEEHL